MTKNQKAIECLETLQVAPGWINDFRKDGTIYSSVRLNPMLDAIIQLPNDLLMEKVKEVEGNYGGLVYHIQVTDTGFGKLYSFLWIPKNEEEWDDILVEQEDGSFWAFAYVYNADLPEFSEFGDIVVKPSMGGVARIG